MVKPLKAILQYVVEGGQKAVAETEKITEAVKKLEAAQKAYNGVAGAAAKNIAAGPKRLGITASDLAVMGTAAVGLKTQFENLALSIVEIGAGLATVKTAGVGVVGFFVGLGKIAADSTTQISTAAAAVGMSADKFEKLRFVATQIGVSASEIESAFSQIDSSVRRATEGLSAQEFSQAISQGLVRPAAGLSVAFGDAGVEVTQFGRKLEGTQAIAGMMGVSFTNLLGTARDSEDVFHDLMVAFARVPDSALKSKLALQVFGENAGKIAPYLALGAEGIKKFDAEFERLGLGIKGNNAAIAVGVEAAFSNFWEKIRSVKNDLGMMFAPLAGQAATGLTEFIVANEAKLDGFANYIATTVKPAIEDFYAAVSGNNQDIKSDSIRQIAVAIEGVATGIEAVVTGVIVPAFKMIIDAADWVANTINSTFGTKVTGPMLALGVVVGYITGGLGLLTSVLGGVGYTVLGVFAGFKLLYDISLLILPAISGIVGGFKALTAAMAANPTTAWLVGGLALIGVLEDIYMHWDKVQLQIKKVTSFWSWAIAKVLGEGESGAAKRLFSEFEDAQKKLGEMARKSFFADKKDRLAAEAREIGDLFKNALNIDTTKFDTIKDGFEKAQPGAQALVDKTKQASEEVKKTVDDLKAIGIIRTGKVVTDKDGKKSYQQGGTDYSQSTLLQKPEGMIGVVRGTKVDFVDPNARHPGNLAANRPSIPGAAPQYTALHKDTFDTHGKIDASNSVWGGGKVEVDKIMTAAERAADSARMAAERVAKLAPFTDAFMGSKGNLNATPSEAQKVPVGAQKAQEVDPAIQAIKTTAKQLADALNPLPAQTSRIPTAFDALIRNVGGLSDAMAEAMGKLKSAAPAGGDQKASSLPGRAEGGLISGPGTGTSDSVPIRASAGEFVVRAARVASLGLDFMHWVNGTKFSMPSSFSGRFADGGLVPAAAGADAGPGRPLTLVIDGKSFGGLSGSGSAVDDLEKHAAMRRMSSTTRRSPSRIG